VSDAPPPVAIIAGAGDLPAEVAAAVAAGGRRAVVLAIRDEADPALEAVGAHWVEWGQVGRLFDLLGREGCRDVVLVGGVSRRPDFRAILGDAGTIRRLPAIIAALAGGDDGVLRKVIRLFEAEGLRVVGAHEVAPSLVAGEGPLGRLRPGRTGQADIDKGAAVVATLGPLDVGQAAVVVAERVVAIEAAEGTDALIDRTAALKAARRIGRGGRGVLVKCAKPGQDLRVDLPTIGPETVRRAAAAGLEGIAVEAGKVLVASRTETIRRADEEGVFLVGVRLDKGSGP
jgi:DUF1009 family protein